MARAKSNHTIPAPTDHTRRRVILVAVGAIASATIATSLAYAARPVTCPADRDPPPSRRTAKPPAPTSSSPSSPPLAVSTSPTGHRCRLQSWRRSRPGRR